MRINRPLFFAKKYTLKYRSHIVCLLLVIFGLLAFSCKQVNEDDEVCIKERSEFFQDKTVVYPDVTFNRPIFNPENEEQYLFIRESEGRSLIFSSCGNDELIADQIFYNPDFGLNGWVSFNLWDDQCYIYNVRSKELLKLTNEGLNTYSKWSNQGNLLLIQESTNTVNQENKIFTTDGALVDSFYSSGGRPCWGKDTNTVVFLHTINSFDAKILKFNRLDSSFTEGGTIFENVYSIEWFKGNKFLIETTEGAGRVYLYDFVSDSRELLIENCSENPIYFVRYSQKSDKYIYIQNHYMHRLDNSSVIDAANNIVVADSGFSFPKILR